MPERRRRNGLRLLIGKREEVGGFGIPIGVTGYEVFGFSTLIIKVLTEEAGSLTD